MVKNNHENTINFAQLSTDLKPSCENPEIIPLITYRDPEKSIDEILNAICKKSSTCSLGCRFKDIVNFNE